MSSWLGAGPGLPLWPRLCAYTWWWPRGLGILSPCCTLPWSPPTPAWEPSTLMWLLLPVLHLACTWRGGHLGRPHSVSPLPLLQSGTWAQHLPGSGFLLGDLPAEGLGSQGSEAAPGKTQEALAQSQLSGEKNRASVQQGCRKKLRVGKKHCFEPPDCPFHDPRPPFPASSLSEEAASAQWGQPAPSSNCVFLNLLKSTLQSGGLCRASVRTRRSQPPATGRGRGRTELPAVGCMTSSRERVRVGPFWRPSMRV